MATEHTFEITIDPNDGSGVQTKVVSVPVDKTHPLSGLDLYKEAALRGAKSAASAQVDYASFSSDSAYLDELDRHRTAMRLTGVALAGPKHAFTCVGAYEDYPEGGTWCDSVDASNIIDAQMQAKWQMALNCRGEDDTPTGADESVSQFFDEMDAQDIIYCRQDLPADRSQLALIKAAPTSAVRIISVEDNSADPATAAMIAEAKSLGVGFVAIPA